MAGSESETESIACTKTKRLQGPKFDRKWSSACVLHNTDTCYMGRV